MGLLLPEEQDDTMVAPTSTQRTSFASYVGQGPAPAE